MIVARASGKSFGAFLKEGIFEPPGMTGTWVYERLKGAPRHPRWGYVNALAYRKTDGRYAPTWGSPPFREERVLTPGAGGVWSSVGDMARWDGAVRDRKLLKPGTWRLALKPTRLRDGRENSYGFGTGLDLDEGGRAAGIHHGGGWMGFNSFFTHHFEPDRGVIILSNRPINTTDLWYKVVGASTDAAARK